MGTSGNIICCKIPDALVKSMKVPIDSENNEETSDIDEIKSVNKKSNNEENEYNGFTQEELEKINERININYSKYQKIPLKSSDINLIYKSGVIRSNSSNI
jgi:hypothetical protein